MKKFLAMILVVFAMAVAGCGAAGAAKVVVDYGDAESFEADLVKGENLEGKTVMFVAGEVQPQSAYGYDVWAGEHLNFVSSRNPDIKEGDTVCVKVTTIESQLKSWIINYEKIDGEIGETTIVSDGSGEEAKSGSEGTSKSEPESESTSKSEQDSESASKSKPESEPTFDCVGADMVGFRSFGGSPTVSAYVAIKNTSDYPISLENLKFQYMDDDKKLLSVDEMAICIPDAIAPGQTGYIYSYYHDISGVDLSNGFTFLPDAKVVKANNFYKIDVEDVSFKTSSTMDIKVMARGVNNTGEDRKFTQAGAVFFDKSSKVVGFCYGYEEFPAGKGTAFEISGDMMSGDYKPEDVDHVEVYIQGNDWY